MVKCHRWNQKMCFICGKGLVSDEGTIGPGHIRLTKKSERESNMADASDTPLERNLQSTIIKKLNKDSRTLVRCRSADAVGHVAGDPDITGCINGWHVEIEVKVPGEEPTRLQYYRLGEWHQVGAGTTWVDTIEEALEFQQKVLAFRSEDCFLGLGPNAEQI